MQATARSSRTRSIFPCFSISPPRCSIRACCSGVGGPPEAASVSPMSTSRSTFRPTPNKERRDRREHGSDRQDQPEVGAQPIPQGAVIVEVAEPQDPPRDHGGDPQARDHLRNLALLHGRVQDRARRGADLGGGRADEPDEQERGSYPQDPCNDVQETEHDHEQVRCEHPLPFLDGRSVRRTICGAAARSQPRGR